MEGKKSTRNKTIDLGIEEGQEYLARCLRFDGTLPASALLDRTICGDSMEILPLLPKRSADLIIADPPYNLTKDFHGMCFAKRSADSYEEYTRAWLSKAAPLLKEDGSIYVCCDWESSLVIGRVLQEFFTVRNRITWQREKGRGAAHNWKNGMEDIWFATNSEDYCFHVDAVKVRRRVIAPYRTEGQPRGWDETAAGNFRDTCPSNFWDDLTVPFWSMPENTAHPTQKPEKLLAKLILASSDPGDLVFDPFLGSGTTSVTAKKLGRHYLGIEANERYCIWCEKRLELAGSDARIQGYEDGIFWERNAGR